MPGYLLDTNVVSETTKDQPEPSVIDFLSRQTDLWLSSLVIHELEFGVQLAPQGRRRETTCSEPDTISCGLYRSHPSHQSGKRRVVSAISGRCGSLWSSTCPYRCIDCRDGMDPWSGNRDKKCAGLYRSGNRNRQPLGNLVTHLFVLIPSFRRRPESTPRPAGPHQPRSPPPF